MKKLLIVVDVQNDFVTGALRNEDAIKTVPNVVKKVNEYLEAGDIIMFTQDTHDEDYLKTEEGRNLPVEHCIYNTEGWQLVPELQKIYEENECEENIYNFDKSSFGSLDLGQVLFSDFDGYDEIEKIEVIGFCTDICVISNALIAKAAMLNTPIYVDAACCAGVTPAAHSTALSAMSQCHIHIENAGKEPWRE